MYNHLYWYNSLSFFLPSLFAQLSLLLPVISPFFFSLFSVIFPLCLFFIVFPNFPEFSLISPKFPQFVPLFFPLFPFFSSFDLIHFFFPTHLFLIFLPPRGRGNMICISPIILDLICRLGRDIAKKVDEMVFSYSRYPFNISLIIFRKSV